MRNEQVRGVIEEKQHKYEMRRVSATCSMAGCRVSATCSMTGCRVSATCGMAGCIVFFLSHSTPDIFFLSFHPYCTLPAYFHI